MKTLNKIIFVIILFLTNINFAQDFDGYKYVIVVNLDYGAKGKDINNIQKGVVDYFKGRQFEVISYGIETWSNSLYPKDLISNECKGLYVSISHKASPPYEVTLDFLNCKKESINKIIGKSTSGFDSALKKIYSQLDEISSYSYDESLMPTIKYPIVENINKDENDLKVYFDTTQLDPIEGIYKTYRGESYYKLGIIKFGDTYKAIIIDSDYSHWKKGDVKIIFEGTAAEGVYSTKYYLKDKTSLETFSNVEGGLINIEVKSPSGEITDTKYLKLYPKN